MIAHKLGVIPVSQARNQTPESLGNMIWSHHLNCFDRLLKGRENYVNERLGL